MLGAGDAFMAGLLRGWVRDEPLQHSLRYANACGAIVVSRHGCAPAMPSWDELNHFLQHGSLTTRLRDDEALEQLHRASTRTRRWPSLAVLAFDHRSQLEELAAVHGASRVAHRRLQAAGRAGGRARLPRGAARGARCGGLAGAGRDHRRPAWRSGSEPPHRRRLVGRPAGRAAGLAPARVRGRLERGAGAAQLAGRARRQVPAGLPPRRRAGAARHAARHAGAAGAGLPRDRPRVAGRSDPAARQPPPTTRTLARAMEQVYARRREPRLVEAAAAGRRRRPGRRSTT